MHSQIIGLLKKRKLILPVDYKKTWFVCPVCAKKLLKINKEAQSKGLFIRCRNCKTDIEIIIKSPTEALKKSKEEL